ncbi:MAG: hypothetical protein VB125_00325 [Burkholderia sp.]
MKSLNKCFAVAIPLLALSGCVALDQTVKSIPQAAAPVAITESLPQICQAAKNNQVRANDLYANKGLSISGEVRSVKEGFKPRYRVFMRVGQISVHAGTENQLNVTQLSVGKTAQVSGVVTDVAYDYNGCAISLKDATF